MCINCPDLDDSGLIRFVIAAGRACIQRRYKEVLLIAVSSLKRRCSTSYASWSLELESILNCASGLVY
jgi:hypothetical protein